MAESENNWIEQLKNNWIEQLNEMFTKTEVSIVKYVFYPDPINDGTGA